MVYLTTDFTFSSSVRLQALARSSNSPKNSCNLRGYLGLKCGAYLDPECGMSVMPFVLVVDMIGCDIVGGSGGVGIGGSGGGDGVDGIGVSGVIGHCGKVDSVGVETISKSKLVLMLVRSGSSSRGVSITPSGS